MYDGNNGNSNVNEHYQPPTYNAPQYPYPPVPQQQWRPMPQYYEPPKPPYSGNAKASFVLGILSFLPFAALLAIIFGILGVRDTRPERMRGRWMAMVGIVIPSTLFALAVLVAFVNVGIGTY